MKPEALTIEKLEEASGMDAEMWHGKCAGLAMHACKLVGGHELYGSWTGPVSADGYWKDYAMHQALGVHPNHGWVLLDDGRVLDPTRWSFENVEPYIFLGHDDDGFYDEGGNRMRSTFRKPCPTTKGPEISFEISSHNQMAIEHITGLRMKDITMHQLTWVACAPFEDLDFTAGPLYEMLIENGLGAFIPLDNKKRAIREGRIKVPA